MDEEGQEWKGDLRMGIKEEFGEKRAGEEVPRRQGMNL